MKKNTIKLLFPIFVLLPVFFFLIAPKLKQSQGAPVTELSDSLSSAQLSYFARLASGNTALDSIITINLDSGTNPSDSTANLFVGDIISIGNTTGGSNDYTVSDIGNTASIALTAGIGESNVHTGAYIVATRSAIHTISFKPQSSISGGDWQVLIKATGRSDENPADGMPDQGGFDLGTLTEDDVVCPWSGVASIGDTVNITSGVSVGSTGPYHLITCALGGTNPIDVAGEITIGVGDSMLINPAPALSHTIGKANSTADTYTIIVRHTDSDGSTIIDSDTTLGKIAVTESVRVTAIIDPTITFYVDNIGTSEPGQTLCGVELSSEADQTTASSVAFGALNLSAFNTLAQRFSCTTNAANGYVVQVYENSQLTSASGTTIPDTNCDASDCTVSSDTTWEVDIGATNSEFGYSLESISSSPVAFEHDGTFEARPFGVGSANAQTIMEKTSTPSSVEQAYICYRITANNYQEAGTYQNYINFVATATF
jgi:hypothetical protein